MDSINKMNAEQLMESCYVAKPSESIFDLMPTVSSKGYILVVNDVGELSGVVTSTDIAEEFQENTKEFLILGQIETVIRDMLKTVFSSSDIEKFRNNKIVNKNRNTFDDMMFGEYIRVLSDEKNWSKFSTHGKNIDADSFCTSLNRVRETRNNVMHFDPDGVPNSEIEYLQNFLNYLVRLSR